MTTREKIHRLVDELPESQLEPLADFLASRDRPGDLMDEWGNLSAMMRASTAHTMRQLEEREQQAGHDPW